MTGLECNREILSTLYSSDLKENTLFLNNYEIIDNKW